MRLLAQASDAQLRIGESILTIAAMDSGLSLRSPRNDEGDCMQLASQLSNTSPHKHTFAISPRVSREFCWKLPHPR